MFVCVFRVGGESCAENFFFSDDNWVSLVKQLWLSPQVKISMWSLLLSGSLRTIPPSPVGLHSPHLSSVVRWNRIQSQRERRQMRRASVQICSVMMLATPSEAFLLLHAEKLSSPATDLSERETLHWALFLKKTYSYMSQYFIAYFSSSVLFLISIIPKSGQDGKKLFVWGCELLLNCIFSESYFRAVTHADACTASDTDSSNAVNSPGSIFLACFFSEDLMWSLCCWMSQSRCLVMAPS